MAILVTNLKIFFDFSSGQMISLSKYLFIFTINRSSKNETFKVNFKHCVGNVHERFLSSEMAYFLFKRTPVTLEFSQRGLQIYTKGC